VHQDRSGRCDYSINYMSCWEKNHCNEAHNRLEFPRIRDFYIDRKAGVITRIFKAVVVFSFVQ